MVFLNPGKPSGQHLSGSLHLPLSITSLLMEATHKHTDSGWCSRGFFSVIETDKCVFGCLPDGVESLCVSYQEHVACTLECCRVYRAGGGRALLWGQPMRLP